MITTVDNLFNLVASHLKDQLATSEDTAYYATTFNKDKGYPESIEFDTYDECTSFTLSGTPIACHTQYMMGVDGIQPIDQAICPLTHAIPTIFEACSEWWLEKSQRVSCCLSL